MSPDNLKCFAKFCAANEWSPWTTRHYVFAAKRAWEWGTDNGWVDVKPIRPSLPKASYKPQDISPADVGALVRNLESNDRTGRAARLVRFCLETGCRPGEARLLRWGDVKIHQSIALLQTDRHKTGERTGKPRTIYLTSGAFELLESMKPHKCAATQYVFVSRLGKPYSRDGLRHILSRRGTYPYALRHTWAQSSVDKGVPLEVVSQAMGHTSLSTTRCYAEVRSERVLRELGSVGSVVQAGLDAQALASKQNASGECETDRSPTAKRRTRGKSGKSRRAS
ncbi:MAG: site-specific integrase [Planctomycetes bacterium]|nr:site-specific integrase [Planctomycetota bacterium]